MLHRRSSPTRGFGAAAIALTAALMTPSARADEPLPARLTLRAAVEFAVAHHPALRSARADEQAAGARVSEARLAELPDVGVTAEINRSTGNAVPGSFFAAPGFPNVAGAPLGQSLDGGTFQTGVSVWGSFDLTASLRQSAVADAAAAARDQAKATTALRNLDVELAAGDAFFALAEAHEAVRAARANVERARVLASTTKPLVEQTLRPGADLARAEAEVAIAETQLARAEQLDDVRRAELARALGAPALHAEPDVADLLGSAPRAAPAAPPAASHPAVVAREAAVKRSSEAQHVVDFD
ncbi:MAG TPA: TolC family protein, partial [Minicystis sp.]|nr:TolC family protein [Minicystis sp.]